MKQSIREQLENLEINWADDLFQNPYASVLTSRLHAERNRLYFELGEQPPEFLPVDMADYYRSKAAGGPV